MYYMWKAFHTEGKLEVSSAHPLETCRYVEVIMSMVSSCLIVFMREYILERNHFYVLHVEGVSHRRETGSLISSPTGNQRICLSNNVHSLIMLVFMREYILERNHIWKAISQKGNGKSHQLTHGKPANLFGQNIRLCSTCGRQLS